MTTFLIDDDPISNYLTETLLREEGFVLPVRTFESAEEALHVLTRNLDVDIPTVVFLDLNMPVMNGWQFLDALGPYVSRLRNRCRVYILTSSLALDDQEKAATYELVDGLIHKPLDRAEIHAISAQLPYGK
jgi:CheY-like chemotaxis protein